MSEAVHGDWVVRSLEIAATSTGETRFRCTLITSHHASSPRTTLKVYRGPDLDAMLMHKSGSATKYVMDKGIQAHNLKPASNLNPSSIK